MSPRRTFRPTVEALERRELMAVADDLLASRPTSGPRAPMGPHRSQPAGEIAGPILVIQPNTEVDAKVVDGVLKIRGGSGKDAVFIGGGDGTFTVESTPNGFLLVVGTLTPDPIPTFTGVTSIDIDLGDGDDSLIITATNVPRLTIKMGAGDDLVQLRGPWPNYGDGNIARDYYPNPITSLDILGDLSVDTGDDRDQFQAAATVHGNGVVRMGAGEDIYSRYAFGTNYFGHISTGFGEFSATGNMELDLGADQDVDLPTIPWQTDARLAPMVEFANRYFEYYQDLIDAGGDTPGQPQLIAPEGMSTTRVDAEGRFEVEFYFVPGYQRVIDQLLARGVTVDAYLIASGLGRASLRFAHPIWIC
ncbi:hypothetical protein [Anatilimnocola floriformis]|uniref:hypothetical protein n=1 Tax=Anatilimnocola floriformis TaxID=2948575 RepID=UPI0020C2CF71|nr:hypothetical protein [Anatilimnocola floriformis]